MDDKLQLDTSDFAEVRSKLCISQFKQKPNFIANTHLCKITIKTEYIVIVILSLKSAPASYTSVLSIELKKNAIQNMCTYDFDFKNSLARHLAKIYLYTQLVILSN